MTEHMKRHMAAVILAVLVSLGGGNVMAEQSEAYALLLDDFTDTNRISQLGTAWEGFTDQVMGGVSEMRVAVESSDRGAALHMTGRVSLENNGGFIQSRLKLAEAGSFDASGYTGIALLVRAEGEHYYLHLRTPRTVFPWAHFAAPIQVPGDGQWHRVEVPFDSFEPKYMIGGRLETARLRSVAIVAAGAAFDADIWVRSIGFYRSSHAVSAGEKR
jgi:hypothetical protein